MPKKQAKKDNANAHKRFAFLGAALICIALGSVFGVELRTLGILLLLVPALLCIHFVQHSLWPLPKTPQLLKWTGALGALTLALAIGTQAPIAFREAIIVIGAVLMIPWLYQVIKS